MTKRKLPTKKAVLILIVIFLLLIIIGVVIYQFRIPISEYKYKKKPTAANLIELSIKLIETNDYDKMMIYLPMAAELNGFVEISKSNQLFISENQDETLAAEETYRIIVVESALSYIYAEKYNDFHKVFPKLYNKIILNDAYSNWLTALEEHDKITKEGYENIIKALDENTPPLLEVKPENFVEIREYAICLLLKVAAYDNMGDMDTGKELYNQYIQLLKDLDSVMKK